MSITTVTTEPRPALSPSSLPPTAFRAWLRLQLMLSGIALVVVAVRSIEMGQMMTLSGVTPHWTPILAVEAAIWLSWSLWGGIVVLVIRRMMIQESQRRRGARLTLLAMIVAPTLIVPLLVGPVHWTVYDGAGLLNTIAHVATHDALTNLLLGATMAGVVHSYLSLQQTRRLEVTAAQLNTQLAGAQLEALRSQLDPHFLFNALNSIAVLARRGQVQAVEQMVDRLSGLLRHSLESSRAQVVPLGVELTAMRYYLEIEQIRYGDRLIIEVNVPERLHARMVPSFLLQPLVENSIRHGFTDPERPLQLGLRAWEEDGRLLLTVEDDGAGLQNDARTTGGIGLGNNRARLTALYGTRASLDIEPGPAGRGTRVTIAIPEEYVGPASS